MVIYWSNRSSWKIMIQSTKLSVCPCYSIYRSNSVNITFYLSLHCHWLVNLQLASWARLYFVAKPFWFLFFLILATGLRNNMTCASSKKKKKTFKLALCSTEFGIGSLLFYPLLTPATSGVYAWCHLLPKSPGAHYQSLLYNFVEQLNFAQGLEKYSQTDPKFCRTMLCTPSVQKFQAVRILS